MLISITLCFSFFTDSTPTEIYTLSLHDALPIYARASDPGLLTFRLQGSGRYPSEPRAAENSRSRRFLGLRASDHRAVRSEEHTSELQSHVNLVCRLLLEKKKNKIDNLHITLEPP